MSSDTAANTSAADTGAAGSPTTGAQAPAARTAGIPAAQPAAPVGAARRRGPFREGERVQLTDERGRMNTISLEAGGAFHTHRGFLNHDEIIGQPDGSVVVNNVGQQYQTLRPLLSDFVLSMPRGAAVVYPKDAGQIRRARGGSRRRFRRAVHLVAARGGGQRLPALL
jgi:tRNA (adenine57-N1/adenine58-N1)-methyltransferase catalytic subunit